MMPLDCSFVKTRETRWNTMETDDKTYEKTYLARWKIYISKRAQWNCLLCTIGVLTP